MFQGNRESLIWLKRSTIHFFYITFVGIKDANHSGFQGIHRLCRSLGIAAAKPGFIDVLKDC